MEQISSFGYWLRRRRKALDLTQDELARQVGCALGTLKKIETDERRPSKQLAERLADCLEIPAAERADFLKAARAELAVDRLNLAAPERAGAAQSATPLPAGTVTFLITDIEGSTQLWERHPREMEQALARHDALLRANIVAHNGVVVKSTGDGIHAVFARATDAVHAAIEAQRTLAAERWNMFDTPPTPNSQLPTPVALRVRIALHSGVTEQRDGDYFGPALNRIARLLSAGHGGQTLLSLASAELVREHLPPDAELRDLGTHRLKDLSRPEQIFQIGVPDLPSDFPPLRTLDLRPTNLPTQPTPLFGRECEIADVAALLRRTDVRLVTLTGPGGTGKTRLALQVAAELTDDPGLSRDEGFANGVYFVDLAPIRDPALVASTIVETLGLKEGGNQPLVQQLRAYLRDKTVLLLLDNFEQVLDAALLVAELLTSAPGLKVLVSSRTVLHVRGEHEFAVPPLALPNRAHLPPLERLTQYAAVQLFIAQAQAAKRDFAVTNATAPAVAEICAQVDGLPLAIELAAARIRFFAPEALLARLGQRLPFLTGGPRDLPLRQQTLRNTIDWSYALLDSAEQALFRRLGVFVGGCTLEAAEAVCKVEDDLPLDVVDGLAALVDKSLLKRVEDIDGAPRFTMLETIREYALERLEASGELELLQQRHATYFVTLAEAGLPYERQEIEFPNIRAALEWGRTEADSTTIMRLVVSLDWRHSVSEARLWLEEALTPRAGGALWPDSASARTLRAKALIMLGNIASWQNDLAAAQPALEDALALFRQLGDTWRIADALSSLGRVLVLQGDHARSGALLEESLAMYRQLEEDLGVAECCLFMGNLAYAQGNLRRAGECWQEALSVSRQLKNTWMIALSLLHLGIVALDQGDHGRTEAHLAESLTLFRELGERWVSLHTLEVAAGLAVAQGSGQGAARLFGADEALRETLGLSILPIWHDNYQRAVAAARALLDDATFAAAWAEGRAMTLEQAITEAQTMLSHINRQVTSDARLSTPLEWAGCEQQGQG